MKNVEWGKFKVGDLFEIVKTSSFNKASLTVGKDYDYVTRTSQNQGILQTTGFVNTENINENNVWSLGLLQMDFFYRERQWYAGQFVRKIVPKINIPVQCSLFFTIILNQLRNQLLSVLVRDVDNKFKESIIYIPTKNGEINFGFMERFVAELEQDRMQTLHIYLQATGLDDYILTEEEENILKEYPTIQWSSFKVGSLFDKLKTKKLPYKADELKKEPTDEFTLPCLTSSFKNQGLNYFVPRDEATILNNVISIPSNSDVYRAYFQSKDFTVLSDAYAIKWIGNENDLSANQYLFAVQAINKVTDLPIYSYKNKLGGWNVVKDKFIQLPVKNNELDLVTMHLLISAIKKQSIKDLVVYCEGKIEN